MRRATSRLHTVPVFLWCSFVPAVWQSKRSPQQAHFAGGWNREVPVGRSLCGNWKCCTTWHWGGREIAYIADEMGLSPHTVRNHSTNLRRKLDVRSSLEAVMAAMRLGVLTFGEDPRETDGS